MTSWQRQATESARATLTVSDGVEKGPESALPFSWDDWFRHADPQQRATALGLAQQQGIVYPHQLPATRNGVHPVLPATKETPVSALLTRLLAGKTEILPALEAEPIIYHDKELDGLQQQAVVRALAAPDIVLLQGLPGTGKSRVLAEIIHQFSARGRRVLFHGTHTASLDVVLERLVGRTEVFALRLLETHEKLETLPAWLRGFTLEEQKQAFLERTLAGARGNREEAESACRVHRAEEPLWSELHECLERINAATTRLNLLDTRASQVDETVEREASTPGAAAAFVERLTALRQVFDADSVGLEAKRQTQIALQSQCDAELTDVASRLVALEPAYLAKKHTRFWTAAFWGNLFNGGIIRETEALLARQAEVQARRQKLAGELAQLEIESRQRRERFTNDRATVLSREVATRRQTLAHDRQTMEAELRRLDDDWNERCQRLHATGMAKTREAVASAQQQWLRNKQFGEEQCQFAHQWSKFVEESGPQLAARLPGFVNVLAATLARWHGDAKLQAAVGGPVDVVIVEDADTLTDADLLKAARHGERCILVSHALTESAADSTARVPPAPAWQRLWHGLGGDAASWPCTWRREQGRLICQLMPLSTADRAHLECEKLADAQDIELCILHRPRSRPCLAQVTFAVNSSFADAFRFMIREVQEFPLEPLGRCAWWQEMDGNIVRHLGPCATDISEWVEIDAGVRLGVINDTQAVRLEFAKSAGWDCARADTWLQRHRPASDGERTVFLQHSYRFQPSLGKLVQAVVRTGDWLLPAASGGPDDSRAFEFAAVPALQKQAWPREGAGLELDLAASRYTDRLPTALRQGLPSRGFVNYSEAQALIRRLETFAQKDVNGHPCRIAVLALYEGQVELLRRLMAQSEVLRNARYPIDVALPTRLWQREVDVVFLSLTRSHGHRAVAFGEDIRELPLALTRARTRLFVFGDPGTLSKRVTWHGPVDQLDALAAHQELVRLARLVALLQSQPATPVHANGKERV